MHANHKVAPSTINELEKAITEFWGERCRDFSMNCQTCRAWKMYDDMADALNRRARSALAGDGEGCVGSHMVTSSSPNEQNDVTLIERLEQIAWHDWRFSVLAHTSDTAREAAVRIRTLAGDGETALAELCAAEIDYRQTHDMKGDGHIATGRAWDRMRRAGETARAALSALPSPDLENMRECLRRHVIRQHERQAAGGGFTPNGGSCAVCRQEWGIGEKERHLAGCLADPSPMPGRPYVPLTEEEANEASADPGGEKYARGRP